jgi:hypothetical protein
MPEVRMVDVDKPIFIKLLEHGEEVGLSGTDFDHVQGWAWENQLISNTQNSENEVSLLRDLFFECFTRNSGNSAEIWVLKNEYYFRLLEYKELSIRNRSYQSLKPLRISRLRSTKLLRKDFLIL